MATGRDTKLTGATGEYLVAAELCRLGFVAAPFAGNVPHYDVIASDPHGGHLAVQVKTIRGSTWQFDIRNFLDATFDGKRQVLGRANRDPAPLITRADLQEFVIHLRERGVTPASCNCWLRGINACTRWLHEQRTIPDSIRVRPQKEEKRLLPIHQHPALRTILGFRPKTFDRWRVYAVACTILDTGYRIDELLTARPTDFDFDNLLLTVVGKGRKQRKVPFSTELRKVLFRFVQAKERSGVKAELMFPARHGGAWEHRNARRSYTCLLRQLGLPPSGFHLLRHTFATQYLRAGGDVVRLSIILGHSEISTTMKYLHLLTEDLQKPHQSLSILNRLR